MGKGEFALSSSLTKTKETTIFHHSGNCIQTADREISIIAKFEEPLVIVLGNVLSAEECDELIMLSKDKMQRSKIGVTREVDEIRTSSGAFIEDDEHPTVAAIEKRISEIMNIPVEHGEGLHILHYAPGQEYKAHFDYFSAKSKAAVNNRISTLVLYLNDVEDGGQTVFPKLNLSVYPKKGMAVYFEYFYSDQELNESTLHAGIPVIKGEKWIATQWMRKQRIR